MRLHYMNKGTVNCGLALDIAAIEKRMDWLNPQGQDWPDINAVEEWYFWRAVKESKGNQSQCGRLLGITRYAVRLRMKRFKIEEFLMKPTISAVAA